MVGRKPELAYNTARPLNRFADTLTVVQATVA
jgi:hypothetical protein